MEVKFANPSLELGLKYYDPPHLTELKEKCSRLFKVQYSKPTRKKLFSIFFRCSFFVFFFLPNKELPFSSVGEPLHDHGHIFA